MIYFDNAATSLRRPPAVGQAVLYAMESFGAAGRGSHPMALAASRCVFQARQAAAELFQAVPGRTVFTANATESLHIALHGLLTPADHVITTALEHNSVLRPLYRLQKQGMGLSIVNADRDGILDYDGFQRSLQKNTKAVICTHASNLTGYLVDLNFISGFCKEHGLLLIVDAAQTAGIFPISMKEMGIDVLCFTGHKGLLGPQGTGGLCVGMGIEIQPLKTGGSGFHSYSRSHPAELPEALEAGTLNAHGLAGLSAGIQHIRKTGIEAIQSRALQLTRQFIAGLKDSANIKIYRDEAHPYGPVVALNIGAMHSGETADILASVYGICVRAGAHCAPLAHMALGTKEQGAVRFSFSSFNTEAEVQAGADAVTAMAQGR